MELFRLIYRSVSFYSVLGISFLVHSPGFAGTPSYVGPYRFIADYVNTYSDSEEGAVEAYKAFALSQANTCAIETRPLSDWPIITPPSPAQVEGVEIQNTRIYEYNWGVKTIDGACFWNGWGKGTHFYVYRNRTVCSSSQRYLDGKCVEVSQITLPGTKPANLGPTCSAEGTHSCGEPINTATGNMWHIETDFKDRQGGDLSLVRTYNSQSWDALGNNQFGTRWTNVYDAKLRPSLGSATYTDQQCFQRRDNNVIFCESARTQDASLSIAPVITKC